MADFMMFHKCTVVKYMRKFTYEWISWPVQHPWQCTRRLCAVGKASLSEARAPYADL